MPSQKLPPLSAEQRGHLERIASEPGKIYPRRSTLIASLLRKEYVTATPAPAALIKPSVDAFSTERRMVACQAVTITASGARRLALKRNPA